MTALTRHGTEVSSVFSLVGHDENDLTAALGFAFARCPRLCEAVLQRVWPPAVAPAGDDLTLALEVRGEDGRTDLEVRTSGALVIFEAKRGWLLPTRSQLGKYAGRVAQHPNRGVLVTLSQASHELARASLPSAVDGVPVVHLPWRDVLTDISKARRSCRGRERLWLDELQNYLRGVIRVRSVADSMTYCVVLNNARPGGGGAHTFREFVTDEHCYFHPYGVNRWPTEPPNFMAFRWEGAVQRIHRVVHAEVVPSLLDRWPDVPANQVTVGQHAIYDLGPRLPPMEPIPSGAQYRAGRLWVLLDQLQTAATLAEALEGTRALQA
ncbi:hypothetical protein [Mycolicibacterium sphagni]|uniref:PD-(D/E)XK nuclease superfamily protein n=1 Tax=Mycolicibacterium sphagni TaxID=1786 RepID=A0ABX2JZD3_9MYCO|nr:hypothetical protein [Mycolicibacterium sphagni]NTY62179.1 hypothetical protein [Mycolicibacterium sphagni]